MSADNWTRCPRCEKDETARRRIRRKQVEDSYGKVPANKYVKLLNTVAEEEEVPYPKTLREGYEIGIGDGFFSVDYRSRCSKCDFWFDHTYTEAVSTTTPDGKVRKKGAR